MQISREIKDKFIFEFVNGTEFVGDLESVIDFIRDNVDIDDVYTDDVIIEYVSETLSPDDVFDPDILESYCDNA